MDILKEEDKKKEPMALGVKMEELQKNIVMDPEKEENKDNEPMTFAFKEILS